jgi:hypothetical protein
MAKNWIQRTPVIIGVGEVLDRPSNLQVSKEPLRLMAEALRRADEDAGGGWLDRIESLDVVNSMTWGYTNLPAQLRLSRSRRNGPRMERSGATLRFPISTKRQSRLGLVTWTLLRYAAQKHHNRFFVREKRILCCVGHPTDRNRPHLAATGYCIQSSFVMD